MPGGYHRPFCGGGCFQRYHRSGFQISNCLRWSFSGGGIAEQMLTEQFIGLRACNISFEFVVGAF